MLKPVQIEFDPGKDAVNVRQHGIGLGRVADFDWSTALAAEDRRADYGEARFVAMGRIDGRLHVLVFTMRPPALRVISLRKANARELEHYGKS